MAIHTIQELQMRQRLPLEIKIRMSQQRIREWINEYGEDGVYISFSGGKDSTVLLHLVRELYPNVRAVFVDTGLEYPEIREFVKTFDNVDIVRPKMTFKQVIETYGYPFISKEVSQTVYYARKYLTALLEKKEKDTRGDLIGSSQFSDLIGVDRRNNKDNEAFKAIKNGKYLELKQVYEEAKSSGEKINCYSKILFGQLEHKRKGVLTGEYSKQYDRSKYQFFLGAPFEISSYCCNIMKKKPIKKYAKETNRVAITGQMAEESFLRTQKWLKYGCNGFELKSPISNPLSFWTEQDILRYIKEYNIKICSVYGNIVVDYDSEDQFDGQLDFSDLGLMTDNRKLKTTGCSRTGCMFCGFGCHLDNDQRFVNMKKTHPKQYDYIMRPKEQGGLNYKEVIDWINNNSDLNIRY